MRKKPFLDYYAEKQIIPVGQDLSDLGRHFRRRSALYRTLGLVPAWLRDKRIIEFGPGTGDNAVFTASLAPALYTLVDGNPASITALKKKQVEGPLRNAEIIESEITDFKDNRRYDLVICEAVISGQTDSEEFLRHIASYTDSGGGVLVTTADSLSLFPEICRRLIKPVLNRRSHSYDALLNDAIAFFTPHLRSLPSMSRHFDDWVLDVILHPWITYDFMTMADAVETLSDHFEIQGTSPQFLNDWRWYKAVHRTDTGRNALVAERYRAMAHAFLDYRLDPESLGPRDNSALISLCHQSTGLHQRIWDDDAVERIPLFLEMVQQVAHCIDATMPTTAKSLRDYIRGMEQMIDGTATPDFGDFVSLFGRGMQYLSFTRRL